MKKYLIFIVGIIIGVAGTSYAAYKLKAEQVSFDNQKTNLNSETVQSAIDELVATITNSSIDNINIAHVDGYRGYTSISQLNDSVEFNATTNKIVATIKKPCQGFIVTDFYFGGNANYGKVTLNNKVIYNDTNKYHSLATVINKLNTKLEVGDKIVVEYTNTDESGQAMLTLIII